MSCGIASSSCAAGGISCTFRQVGNNAIAKRDRAGIHIAQSVEILWPLVP